MDISGKRQVIWYDWNSFMNKYFCTIPGILQYHHLTASEEVIKLISDMSQLDSLAMPDTITPAGMSFDRQVYLYEKIRPFCTSQVAALLTCPAPASDPTPPAMKVKSKKTRKCSHCHQPRHTKTVCAVTTCPELLNS